MTTKPSTQILKRTHERYIAEIADLLIPAYSFLFDKASADGHWSD